MLEKWRHSKKLKKIKHGGPFWIHHGTINFIHIGLGCANKLVSLLRPPGFENNFNGTTFYHHFCLKTGVSRNGLTLGYSEKDTSSVFISSFFIFLMGKIKSF